MHPNCYRCLQTLTTFVIVERSCCIYRQNRSLLFTTAFKNTASFKYMYTEPFCIFHQGTWYRSGSMYLRILVGSSTKIRTFINLTEGSVKVAYKRFLPPCLACKVWPGYWLQLAAHVWLLMSIVFSTPLCISCCDLCMVQGKTCSLGICHLNLSLELYASVRIMHVKVLMFTAACNNSCVAFCACHEHIYEYELG